MQATLMRFLPVCGPPPRIVRPDLSTVRRRGRTGSRIRAPPCGPATDWTRDHGRRREV